VRIDKDACIACELCVPYCPMGAITIDDVAVIDQEECVDCGACSKSKVCPVDAFVYEEPPWPRLLRGEFSNPTQTHVSSTGLPGRGTEEVKTNEVTGRLKPGYLAIGVEFGRPSIGARFRDIEKVAMALAKVGVKFEKRNPVTYLMEDPLTGKMKPEILNEKILSGIIECVFPRESTPQVLETLREATKQIDTVCSVEIMDLVDSNDEVPMEKMLKKLGICYRINGKTNVGLGRLNTEGEE